MLGRAFDCKIDTYDEFAAVQNEAALSLLQYIPKQSGRVLEVGAGTGTLTKSFFETCNCSRYHVAELSKTASFKLKARYSGIEIFDEGLLSVPDTCEFDLVISSSALHWVRPFAEASRKIKNVLSQKGLCLFSLMLHGTLAELHEAKTKVLGYECDGWELPTADAVVKSFFKEGFSIRILDQYSRTIKYPSSKDLLHALNQTGVNARIKPSIVLNRSQLKSLESVLGSSLTYQIGVFEAKPD